MQRWFKKSDLNGDSARHAKIPRNTPSSSIFDGFLRGVDGSLTPPAARFLREEEILARNELIFNPAVQPQEGKIFLGLLNARCERMQNKPGYRSVGGKPIGICDDRHIVTIAGNRSGKGRSTIIPNLLHYPGSMLVVDPKGDLATITARRRQELGQRVHVLDPFKVAEVPDELRASFNPVEMLEKSKTLVEDAGAVADGLVPSAPDNRDPHWDESAKQFIETLVTHIATSPIYGGGRHQQKRDLLTLNQLVSEALLPAPDGKFALCEELLSNGREGGVVARGARAFYDRNDREMQSVLSTVRRHLHFLDYPHMRSVLSGKGIDLRNLKRQATTIYLTLPAMRMASCSRWLRLIVNLVLAAAEDESVDPANPHALLLCLDEFAVLGTMKSIEDAAGQIAGFNVRLWPILQDLSQLRSLYHNRWETFLGNAGVMQFFGNSDLTTLEWISKRLGKTRAFTSSPRDATWQGEMNQDSGDRRSEANHPLLSPDEVARFFGRDDPLLRQLIIRPGFAPMVLHRALYDQHELFANMFDARRAS